ncbi:Imm72 family immunity protein [Burkholderia seminalis]|uniref:Imm72 family immunity protein n=1 Tax=Burkholderia seminalis TaxID=488731 RepID=UPI00265688A5|nr:Imm72 family immunity protein [Burkholderia seminalis]MDN7592380.1 Imm72 family immunity protein [Burkholderia seminalis]
MTDTIKQYDMTDDATRRRIFWLLQRLTSYSLWKRKRDAFAIFANEYENAVKTWPEDDPERVPADHLPTIFEVLAAYDRGLPELACGYRFVWQRGEPLQYAVDRSNYLNAYFFPHYDYWERGAQFAPYPPKVDALAQLLHASEYQMESAPFEPSSLNNDLAQLRSVGLLLSPNAYKNTFYTLPYPVFPEALPEVPEPVGTVIRSGEKVPCDGIWEPVAVEQSKLLGIVPVGDRSLHGNGCFNYLIRDIRAPNLRDDDARVPVKTHWRLLWEDKRYADGIIPDESQYFLEPPAPLPDQETVAEVRTGDRCPVSGEWQTDEYGGKKLHIEAGAAMPDMLVRDNLGELKVHWVTWRLVKRS